MFFDIDGVTLSEIGNESILDIIMADRKQCIICHHGFDPNPKVAKRQTVCKRLACQRERKRQSQQKWVKNNPDYFKGRYENTKQWLSHHPDYLKNYRHRQKATASCDIQDELTLEKTALISKSRDIQDELMPCLDKHIARIDKCVPHDIQDDLTLYLSITLLVLIYKSRLPSC